MPRETIEVKIDENHNSYNGIGLWFWDRFKKKPKSEGEKLIESYMKSNVKSGTVGTIAPPFFTYPPAKSKEYQTITDLLNDAEKWHGYGDTDLESKVWQMIADKAKEYSIECERSKTH